VHASPSTSLLLLFPRSCVNCPGSQAVCVRTKRPTYEKPGSACDSRVVLLRGVQAMLIILSSRSCFSSVSSMFCPGYGSFLVRMLQCLTRVLPRHQNLIHAEPKNHLLCYIPRTKRPRRLFMVRSIALNQGFRNFLRAPQIRIHIGFLYKARLKYH